MQHSGGKASDSSDCCRLLPSARIRPPPSARDDSTSTSPEHYLQHGEKIRQHWAHTTTGVGGPQCCVATPTLVGIPIIVSSPGSWMCVSNAVVTSGQLLDTQLSALLHAGSPGSYQEEVCVHAGS